LSNTDATQTLVLLQIISLHC